MEHHPRTMTVQRACLDIRQEVWRIAQTHGLTYIEAVQCLTQTIDMFSREALQRERHPNSPDTPADLVE